jgi:NAD-dependent SIR2 family protein deacetylase
VAALEAMFRAASHVVVHTGAGLSTAAGIADYRGPQGLYTQAGAKGRKAKGRRREPMRLVTDAMAAALPTPAHASLAALCRRGLVAHVVTQNVDGLHRRAGTPPALLTALHGDIYEERCAACGAAYLRDLPCARPDSRFRRHATGGACAEAGCGGALQDTLVHARERLQPALLARAQDVSGRPGTLSIVLGSSLAVPPASLLPGLARRKGAGGRMVVVSLTRTAKDRCADLVLRADCQAVVRMLEQRLASGAPESE